MGFHLIKPLALQVRAYLRDVGAGAGAGKGEGSFERGWILHEPHMGADLLKT